MFCRGLVKSRVSGGYHFKSIFPLQPTKLSLFTFKNSDDFLFSSPENRTATMPNVLHILLLLDINAVNAVWPQEKREKGIVVVIIQFPSPEGVITEKHLI